MTTTFPIEEKINTLLRQMTLNEKIGQMNQLSGTNEYNEEMIRKGAVGSFLNVSDVDDAKRYQKLAVEETRLGIPLVMARDVIHGFKTLFPIPLAQSCSWNEGLIEEGCHIAAKEAKAHGYHWTFAPMIDISRDPRWGRIAESLGEDPLLCGRLGAAMVRGFQGDDPAADDRLAACAKHLVGYGAAEGGRDYNTTIIPERSMRDTYLPPFKASVDAGALTMMSAFNEINDIPASANHFTLKQILRDEWKYDGMVVSDWGSVTEMISHGFAQDEKESAKEAINAGIDMEMVTGSYVKHAKELLAEGAISMETIDNAVRNVLRLKFRLNLFENPYFTGDTEEVTLCQSHLDAARKAARESMVLLKNNYMLPLKAENTVALIGPLTHAKEDQVGCWSMDLVSESSVTVKEAFESSAFSTTFAAGLDSPRSTETKGFAKAIANAHNADIAVMIVGEDAILSGESHSRAFIDLPGKQTQLIEAVAATGTKVVLVVMAGRPLTLGSVLDKVDAILYAWHPGTMAGPAVLDLLSGIESPSGRLTVSFPHTVGQIPVYYSRKNTGRPPREEDRGIPAGTPLNPEGFASYYLDVDFRAQFPFGFGLTYSTVTYSTPSLSTNSISTTGSLTAFCEITNTGDTPIHEVVQLYVRDLVGTVTRPIKELKDFKRVALAPGETATVKFTLTADQLAFHNRDMQRVVESGEFHLWIAPHSEAGDPVSFTVKT